MQNDSINTAGTTYEFCTVQLSLFSLILLTSLNGLCGGIAWSILLILAQWAGLVTLENFEGPVGILIGFSVLGAFGSALFALIGYPIYNWICKRIHGQRLSGVFYSPHN